MANDGSGNMAAVERESSSHDEVLVQETVTVEEKAVEGPDPSATSATLTVVPVDWKLPMAADLARAVEGVSGTTVQRMGGLGDFSAISIRGSTLRQVQVYLDGVPLNPDGANVVNLAEFPLQAFSRIEVYAGNAPILFGAAPIGGVVNLVTGDMGDVPSSAALTWGDHHTARLTTQSFASTQSLKIPGEFLLVADTFFTEGDYRYFSDNGTPYTLTDDHILSRDNNDKTQLNVYARCRLGDPGLRLTVLDALLDREEGVPGHANASTEDTRLATLRNVTTAELEWGQGRLRQRTRLWNLWRRETFDDRSSELGVGTQYTQDTYTNLGARWYARFYPSGRVLLESSLEVRRDAYDSFDLLNETSADPRYRNAATASASGTASLWQGRLTLSGILQGFALDNRALRNGDGGEATTLEQDVQLCANPRVGVLLTPLEGLSLKANLGRYLRPPDFTELFGYHGFIQGNDDLVPEQGWQGDVGARALLPARWPLSGVLDLSYFENHASNLIVMTLNGQGVGVPVNVGSTRVRGLESSLVLRGWGWFDVQAGLTRFDSANRSENPAYGGKELPRIPPWVGSLQTSIHWEELVTLGYSFQYAASNYWDLPNINRSMPRGIHNMFVRLRPVPGWPSIELNVLNLTDHIVEVAPRNPVDPDDTARVVQLVTDFSDYPLPGRTILLSVRWSR